MKTEVFAIGSQGLQALLCAISFLPAASIHESDCEVVVTVVESGEEVTVLTATSDTGQSWEVEYVVESPVGLITSKFCQQGSNHD